ncbi:MAG: DUF1015 domain-containing protein [Anaerolineaceae bacterium]|nr:DUF1015 domain-containing protein [Anaerolineaceae bacterium]
MRNYPDLGIQIPDILLPNEEIDPSKWAVIACDQFTSEPEYWAQVESLVGDSPSTLQMVLPEVFLGKPEEESKLTSIQNTMKDYISKNILKVHEGLILVKRTVAGKTRLGIVLALDLEKYDFNKGSQSLIRATEGTIIDRLPPRIKIREGAELELPHILVLIDDPKNTVIEPLAENLKLHKKLYDFELMLGSGHLEGHLIKNPQIEKNFISALSSLADPEEFNNKYNLTGDHGLLLFAMGDGNHSLATAKAIWEKNKAEVGMDHPSRYALVEIENVHDQGLEFEPIHRVTFENNGSIFDALKDFYGARVQIIPCTDEAEMIEKVNFQTGNNHIIGFNDISGFYLIEISAPTSNLPVGTIQEFLDSWIENKNAKDIDYVHGSETTFRLGKEKGNAGFYLPPMDKSDLFKTVILDGALPRKTFSMGEAIEKRFYFESRKIM